MSRVTYFEVIAQDAARAIRFYTEVFGWAFAQFGEEPYWLIRTGPDEEDGINGGLVLRQGAFPQPGQPVNAFVCTISVANLDQVLTGVEPLGGRVTIAKHAVPGIGWRAYAMDTEGNVIAILQVDESVT